MYAGFDDSTAWCKAERGRLIRYFNYDCEFGSVEQGVPLAAEAGLRPISAGSILEVIDAYAPPDLVAELRETILLCVDDEETEAATLEVLDQIAAAGRTVPDLQHATTIAGRTSINLLGLGPHTRVAGHGVLALTACGRREGHRGAFPL